MFKEQWRKDDIMDSDIKTDQLYILYDILYC